MSEPYTFAELWDAVLVLNDRQPRDEGKDYILSMIIPPLVLSVLCEDKYGCLSSPNRAEKLNAVDTLMRAYWDLCQKGVYNLKEEDCG